MSGFEGTPFFSQLYCKKRNCVPYTHSTGQTLYTVVNLLKLSDLYTVLSALLAGLHSGTRLFLTRVGYWIVVWVSGAVGCGTAPCCSSDPEPYTQSITALCSETTFLQ